MLLVHIAGHADLGAPSPFEDPDKIGPLRAEELQNCMTPHEAARRLFDLSFTRTPSHENTDAAHSPYSGSALRKEFTALSQLSAATGTDETTEVLVIGVEGGDTPTDGLARTLVDALRIASSEAADLAGTRKIIIHNVCILPSLAVSSESITRLERRIGAYDGHVLLAMAGGATAVLVEAEDVNHRFAAFLRGVLAVDVDDNEGAFRHDALDVGVRLRVLLEEGAEGINERLAAVGHARIVLDVGLGDVFFDRLVQLVLVEGEFVEGDDVFLVAREVVAGGKCQRGRLLHFDSLQCL